MTGSHEVRGSIPLGSTKYSEHHRTPQSPIKPQQSSTASQFPITTVKKIENGIAASHF